MLESGSWGHSVLQTPALVDTKIHVFNANIVDPDQTLRSAASDLGLRCFLMPLLWDARLKW